MDQYSRWERERNVRVGKQQGTGRMFVVLLLTRSVGRGSLKERKVERNGEEKGREEEEKGGLVWSSDNGEGIRIEISG